MFNAYPSFTHVLCGCYVCIPYHDYGFPYSVFIGDSSLVKLLEMSSRLNARKRSKAY